MSRKPLIAGNWKMFKTGPEAIATAEKLVQLAEGVKDTDIMIAPTFLSLPLVSRALTGSIIKTGAQNLFYEKQGAFTGEVSADMVKAAGADYVIIGHSERRQYFHETDENVFKKIKAAFGAGLTPILCIGETDEEKKAEKTFSVLDKQIRNGLKGFRSSDEVNGLVIAYEPVWAIGTGNVATPDEVEKHPSVCAFFDNRYLWKNACKHNQNTIWWFGQARQCIDTDVKGKYRRCIGGRRKS